MTTTARFENVSCSQCGGTFGPGEHGFSHCDNHQGMSMQTNSGAGDLVSGEINREMIELAAKAALIEGYEMGVPLVYEGKTYRTWSPLNDDGDALRLAVKLGIDLSFYVEDELKSVEPFPVVEASWNACNFDGKVGHAEPLENDPYAATRRAIVCAAAEIAKAGA